MRDDFPILGQGPEVLFGITDLWWAEGTVIGEMVVQPWMSSAGALGVLFDDVLGYAILQARSDLQWSVSTEIAFDAVGPLPEAGTVVRAEARLAHHDSIGGLSLGRIIDANGREIAHGRQRGRYVPVDGDFDPSVTKGLSAARPESPLELLDTSTISTGHLEIEGISAFANPLGNVHGGITLFLSDLLAGKCVDSTQGLQTASVHVTYLRPIRGDSNARFNTAVVHRGRSLGVAHVGSEAVDGRPFTVATVTSH